LYGTIAALTSSQTVGISSIVKLAEELAKPLPATSKCLAAHDGGSWAIAGNVPLHVK